MRGYVGVTDYGWYRHLHARPHLDEVNFWRPGGTSFKALPPGGLYENERTYYALDGRLVLMPADAGHRPDPELLEWRGDIVYRG